VHETFRTKRDAVDWARSTEDEMTRGLYICRASSERMTIWAALERYLAEVSARKKLRFAIESVRERELPLLTGS